MAVVEGEAVGLEHVVVPGRLFGVDAGGNEAGVVFLVGGGGWCVEGGLGVGGLEGMGGVGGSFEVEAEEGVRVEVV